MPTTIGVSRSISSRGVKAVRGAVDTHLHQIVDSPSFFVNVDRVRASEIGLTELQIANDLNTSLSSSFQVSPNFWADPKTGGSVPGGRADAGVPPEQHKRPHEHAADAFRPRRHEAGNAFERGDVVPRADADADNPQQYSKNLRHLRQRTGPRPWLGRSRPQQILPEFQAAEARQPIVLRGQIQSKNDAFRISGSA